MEPKNQPKPCERLLVAFVVQGVSKNRIEIKCDPENCLSLRIWGDEDHVGAGVNRVAQSELVRRDIEGAFDGAYVTGNCRERHA